MNKRVLLFLLTIAVILLFITYKLPQKIYISTLDFSKWKEGSYLYPEHPLPKNFYVVYTDSSTGEQKEFLSSLIPTNDTSFSNRFSYSYTHIEDPNLDSNSFRIHRWDFYPQPLQEDYEEKADVTSETFNTFPELMFLVFRDVKSVSSRQWEKISKLMEETDHSQPRLTLFCLSSTFPKTLDSLRADLKLPGAAFYYVEQNQLKDLTNSNPCAIYVRNGQIIKKWNAWQIPSYKDIPRE